MSPLSYPLAATRDAAWRNCPDCTKVKKYHVMLDGETPACGLLMFDNEDDQLALAEVEPARRCQRNGCRQLWPKDSP